MVIKKLRRQ